MEAKQKFLLPGEYTFSLKPQEVTTLLGSCVAVCLFFRPGRYGGMNHYLLPYCGNGHECTPRYGDTAIDILVEDMRRHAGTLRGVEAMVFGGASVLSGVRAGIQIGMKNVALARRLLHAHGIPIIREIVGGNQGLRVVFRNWDNKASVRRLEPVSEVVRQIG